MAAAAEVAWDQLSRGAKEALSWARAAEVESHQVGTRGLLIGMLRSGEDPPNALLRHFGVGEDELYPALQAEDASRLEPFAPDHPTLDTFPELTPNADRTLGLAALLQREIAAPQIDVGCLFAALLQTRGATARNAIEDVIHEAPIAEIERATADWLHDQRLTYPEMLKKRLPRAAKRPGTKGEDPRPGAPSRAHDDSIELRDIALEEMRLAPLVHAIRDVPDEELPAAVFGLADAAANAATNPRPAIVDAVTALEGRGLLSPQMAMSWIGAASSPDATGLVEYVEDRLPQGTREALRTAVLRLAQTTIDIGGRFPAMQPADDRDVFDGLLLDDSVRDAVGWATALADLRPETPFDSTVLLCGFVLHAQPQPDADTSVAVANELKVQMATDERGIVARLLDLEDPLPSEPAGLPALAQQSDDLRRVVEDAVALASSFGRPAVVSVRHVLAALLRPRRPSGVMARLRANGVSAARLRVALNDAFMEASPDDLERWADVLETTRMPPPSRSVLAGYDSDDVGSDDRLNIKSDVETLASVLAAKAVEPPISVGLFGDWGTGKSFFMHALERRIRVLEAATDASDGESAYCRRIKHIRFNAWHYADANLWASLVTEIFDALASTDDERTRAMLTELDTAKRARRDAEGRHRQALAVRERLEERIGELERSAQKPARLARTSLGDRSAAPASAVALLDEVEDKARPDDRLKLRDVSKLADDLAGIGGATRTVIRIAGRRRVLVAVVVALVVAAATFAVLQLVTGDALGAIAAVVSVIAALGAALRSPIAQARQAAQAAADAAQLVQDEVRRAEVELAAQAAERERLAQQLVEVESDVAATEREVQDVTGGRMLARFVQERAAADDYRRYLGLVSLIRRDFVTLSTLMSEADDPPFDRIVLYIDDLDRCAPSRVVEVLEAVHLLLALRVFVVVVAVDSRWLLRSLEIHYHALRQSEDVADVDDDYWVATPQNYLEKIFQIPYAVRPMGPEGYCSLVDSMVATAPAVQSASADEAARTPAPTAVPTAERVASEGEDREPLEQPRAHDAVPAGSQRAADEPGAASAPRGPELDLTPAALSLTDLELASIRALAPLIKTPRAAKRLVNTYRFARASLDPDELSAFVGDDAQPGEHRAALLLLAILIGFPTRSAELFRALLDLPLKQSWSGSIEGLTAGDRELARAVAQATIALSPPESLAPYARWAARVGRYSFHTSRLVVPDLPAPPPPPGP